jgi:transposase
VVVIAEAGLEPGTSSKLHLAGERGGLPLSVVLSAANVNDATMFEAVLDDIPLIRMPTGRRRRRPGKVHADKAYDHRRCRAYLRRRGIQPRIARRMVESSVRLGRHRWTIERTGAWLGGFRRLRIRYERSSERFYAWPCWPAQSSASTPSSSHPGDRSGTFLSAPEVGMVITPSMRGVELYLWAAGKSRSSESSFLDPNEPFDFDVEVDIGSGYAIASELSTPAGAPEVRR